MSSSPSQSQAPFLQTSTYFPEDFDEFRVKFLSNFRDIASTVNVRQIGIFDQTEQLTGEQWFTPGNPQVTRQPYRKVFQLGGIAPGATATIGHSISNLSALTHAYGTAVTDVVDYRPIPYASATLVTDQISLTITSTSVVVVNGATAPAITSGFVVLEFLKN